MRRLVLPILILAIAVTGVVLTKRANSAADPGHATAVSEGPSLASPILSARRAPEWLVEPKVDNLLSGAIASVLAGAPSDTCVLVQRDGVDVASNNTGAPIRPASLLRLLTITALDSTGSDVGFRTEVAIHAEAEISEEGELDGDLWLIGGGDPVLSTTDYISRFGDDRPFTNFGTLVADTVTALQDLGITVIRGRVIGDQTKYDGNEYDYVGAAATDIDGAETEVWTREDIADNAVGPLSAQLLNDGFDSWPEEGLDTSQNVRSDNPSISAATALDNALEEAGITISRSPRDEPAPPLIERDTLAAIDSPPLAEILNRAMIDATTAEMLFKEIGVRLGGTAERASTVLALHVLGGFTQAGLPFELASTRQHDGSGLSDLDRTSCDMIHATIASGPGASAASPIADSPVSACAPRTDGELSVVATVSPSTTGLAGHFVAANGDRLTFTLLVDEPDRFFVDPEADPPEDGEEIPVPEPLDFCNPIQSAMLAAVAGHPYGPDLDVLSPLEPVDG